jgi:hypothetical protein
VLPLPLPCHTAEEREVSPLAGTGGESGAGGGAEVGGMGGERESARGRVGGRGPVGRVKRKGEDDECAPCRVVGMKKRDKG